MTPPLLILGVLHPSSEPAAEEAGRPGGDLTSDRRAPGLRVAPNVPKEDRMALTVGRSFFATPWVRAPASTTARDGLGPLFNARACTGCHPAGGRAVLDGEGEAPVGLVFRLGLPARHDTLAVEPDPIYGGQLQTYGAAAVGSDGSKRPVGEGRARIAFRGEPRRVEARVDDPAYGPLDPGTKVSARLGPALHGIGLLDAIETSDLLAAEDPEDGDGDGISGRANRVPDVVSGETAVGRFGHKARHPNARQQIAAAFRDDMGITNVLFPEESCTDAQSTCRRAPRGVGPDTPHEIRDDLLEAVVTFTRVLAVPARGPQSEETEAGRRAFDEAGCAACHTPSFRTSATARPAMLAGQTIWPYTDLLLHDMGPGLSDGLPEFAATPTEWRTAPLWGLGVVPDGERSLLHDGRAKTLEEAIRWHDGEAAAARARYDALRASDRRALLVFLNSL